MSLIERAAARLNRDDDARTAPKSDSVRAADTLKEEASRLTDVALQEQQRRAAKAKSKRKSGEPVSTSTANKHANNADQEAFVGVDDEDSNTAVDPEKPSKPDTDRERHGDSTRRRRLKLKLANVQGEFYLKREGAAPAVVSQFRSIRRPLIANAHGRGLPAVENGRTIMVTSALPGEGKTFCSIHMALAISIELDCSVILVELDLIKPSLLKSLGVSTKHGVTDWFQDTNASIDDYILDTNVRDLKILPSGTGASNAANMLSSKRLEVMFDQIRETYPNHFIVLDTPPVIPASEARVLPNYAGQVAFVVAAGETPATAVTEGLEYVQGCEVVGLIMNKFRPDKVYSSYGY